MSRFRILLFTVVGILMSASIAFAQVEAATGAGDNASSVNKYRAIAAGIGSTIESTLNSSAVAITSTGRSLFPPDERL